MNEQNKKGDVDDKAEEKAEEEEEKEEEEKALVILLELGSPSDSGWSDG